VLVRGWWTLPNGRYPDSKSDAECWHRAGNSVADYGFLTAQIMDSSVQHAWFQSPAGDSTRHRLSRKPCSGTTSVVSIDAVPADPLAALRELTRGEAELEALRRAKVEAARASGASWEQVGEPLGISRQSAWEYYSSSVRSKMAATVDANGGLSEADAMDLAVDEVRAVQRRRRDR